METNRRRFLTTNSEFIVFQGRINLVFVWCYRRKDWWKHYRGMPDGRKNGYNYYDGKITKLTERLNWNLNRDDIALRCIFHYVNLIFIVMQICNYLSLLKFIQRTRREQGFMIYTVGNKSYSFSVVHFSTSTKNT